MSWREAVNSGESSTDAEAGSPRDQARCDTDTSAGKLHPGQPVQARIRGVVHWEGTVETVSASLGVVWIRENGLGERKLLDLREYHVFSPDSPDR